MDKHQHITLYSVKAQEAFDRRKGSIGSFVERPYSSDEAAMGIAPPTPETAEWWQAQLNDGSVLGPCRAHAMEKVWRKQLLPESLVLSKKLPGWTPLSEVPNRNHYRNIIKTITKTRTCQHKLSDLNLG